MSRSDRLETVRPPEAPKARRENVERFLAETDPELIAVMRKTGSSRWKNQHRRAGKVDPLESTLTPEEHALLDAWLRPRIEALAERWADMEYRRSS